MNYSFAAGNWGALIARLSDRLADPATLTTLQERLARHGAELSGQLPELLLRVPDPQKAVSSWLADKDLSHWIPQAEGGSAAQGWQFETASWNRARGAEPMDAWEKIRVHLDGGFDALVAEGMPVAIGIECLEAALLAAGLHLTMWLLAHRIEWNRADAADRQKLLKKGLADTGLAALGGAAASLTLTVALALLPAGQAILVGLSVVCLGRSLPSPATDPFDLRSRCKKTATG